MVCLKGIQGNERKIFRSLSKMLLSVLLLFTFIFTTTFAVPTYAAPTVTVTTTSTTAGVSKLKLGVTHTQLMWEQGNTTAVNRAKALLNGPTKYHNQHIMGWGADNPQPTQGGAYNWTSLDARVNLMRTLGGEMVLTFCTAPGWMKTSGQDWNMDDRVADNHVTDFANLCQAVAQRYTDVKYFQIWNEMKGYWNSSLNNWDMEKYNTMYNAVYSAVKSVRPDAVIGGFYLSVRGDAAATLGKTGSNTFTPFSSGDMSCLTSWVNNVNANNNADFVCLDRWVKDFSDPNTLTENDAMNLTWVYKKCIQDIRSKTNRPIWYSEYYSLADYAHSESFYAANMASIYYNMIKGDIETGNYGINALLWDPEQGENLVYHHLFTDTASSSGGQATSHYYAYKNFSDYFGYGTQLYEATSSDPMVEVLASDTKVMLINKYNASQAVTVNGTALTLSAYEVRVIDKPGGGGGTNLLTNPGFESDLLNWTASGSAPGWIATDNYHSGIKCFNMYSASSFDSAVQNTKTGCAAGTYTAKMWARGGGTFSAAKLEVWINGVWNKEATFTPSTMYTQITVSNITVPANASVALKAYVIGSAGAWIYVDDFELIKN